MITPEPSALEPESVTSTSTTAGRIFAIAASRTVSSLVVVAGCTAPVVAVVVALARVEAVLVLLNCQPANRPTPKMTASSRVKASKAPFRTLPDGRVGWEGGIAGESGACPGKGGSSICVCSGYEVYVRGGLFVVLYERQIVTPVCVAHFCVFRF